MRLKRPDLRTIALFWLWIVLMPNVARARPDNDPAITPPQIFVQQFYDWYAPRAVQDNRIPAWVSALKSKAALFDARLAAALRAGAEAQARTSGDIAGIDFDPFLGSQDPEEKYAAGQPACKGRICRVAVYGAPAGKRRGESSAIVELRQKPDGWLIANLHYPKNGNLLAILQLLEKSRQKPSRKSE
jgi:hypothetical protein